ncbi:hypothetical protein B6U81_01105 [Thermoplasmatales archaeon ex4484_30]|nr:MAG: hypothetical protein B6U81_01105 [Thermoplasmatales archaeon ex4484_30]
MKVDKILIDLIPEEPQCITIDELMQKLGFSPLDNDYNTRKDYIMETLKMLSNSGKIVIKTAFSKPKLITKFIPILQEAKKKGFIMPNPYSIDYILFLKKHGYVIRDDNKFILSHKGEWLLEEVKRGDEGVRYK